MRRTKERERSKRRELEVRSFGDQSLFQAFAMEKMMSKLFWEFLGLVSWNSRSESERGKE